MHLAAEDHSPHRLPLTTMPSSLRWVPVGLAGTLLILTAQACSASSPGPESFVLTEKEPLFLDSPELVASGEVKEARWSTSGKFVLVVREGLPFSKALAGERGSESSLLVWRRSTQQTRPLWS